MGNLLSAWPEAFLSFLPNAPKDPIKDLVRDPALTLLWDLSRFFEPDCFLSSSSESFCWKLDCREGSSPGGFIGLEILGTDSVRGRDALGTAEVDFERGRLAVEPALARTNEISREMCSSPPHLPISPFIFEVQQYRLILINIIQLGLQEIRQFGHQGSFTLLNRGHTGHCVFLNLFADSHVFRSV